MTNTDTDGDKYVINGVEVTPVEAIEIITAFFKKQQFRVGRLKARIAELEAEVTKCHELQDSYCDRIAELEATQRWIPVSERLPEHGDFVLAWDNEIIEVLEYIRTFGGEWFIDIADAAVYPTHWMPLPEPPIVYGKVCEE